MVSGAEKMDNECRYKEANRCDTVASDCSVSLTDLIMWFLTLHDSLLRMKTDNLPNYSFKP